MSLRAFMMTIVILFILFTISIPALHFIKGGKLVKKNIPFCLTQLYTVFWGICIMYIPYTNILFVFIGALCILSVLIPIKLKEEHFLAARIATIICMVVSMTIWGAK